jgi:uncharacterized protein YxeA
MKKLLILIILLLIVLIGFFNYRTKIKSWWLDLNKPGLPEEIDYQKIITDSDNQTADEQQITNDERQVAADEQGQTSDERRATNDEAEQPTSNIILPTSYNLAVPFTPQAPHADWIEPFKEACEEASVLMAHWFYTNQTVNPNYATDEIVKMVAWQQKKWGGHFDLTMEQTAELVKEYLGYKKVEIIANPTINDIKFQLSQNRPVIMPAAGRSLGNPYFTQPGPIYHMLVIKGYTKTQFITNDPGTKRGEDYLYDFETIMSALHDWNETDINRGAKKILIIYPN